MIFLCILSTFFNTNIEANDILRINTIKHEISKYMFYLGSFFIILSGSVETITQFDEFHNFYIPNKYIYFTLFVGIGLEIMSFLLLNEINL
jgi:hypothetical protein